MPSNGPPPGSDATAWDMLLYYAPDYADLLTSAAKTRLQQVPAVSDPTLAGQLWGAASGRDLAGTAYYAPGTVAEREHIFAGAERLENPETWQHETLHALERLGGVNVGELWGNFTPAFQERIQDWYGTSSPDMPSEAFVYLAQQMGFDPWKIPPEYQSLFTNIYQSGAFVPPPLPAPLGFYQRYKNRTPAGSRAEREATLAKREGIGAGQSWGVALPPVMPPQITSTDKSSSSQNKNWSSGGGSKR